MPPRCVQCVTCPRCVIYRPQCIVGGRPRLSCNSKAAVTRASYKLLQRCRRISWQQPQQCRVPRMLDTSCGVTGPWIHSHRYGRPATIAQRSCTNPPPPPPPPPPHLPDHEITQRNTSHHHTFSTTLPPPQRPLSTPPFLLVYCAAYLVRITLDGEWERGEMGRRGVPLYSPHSTST